MLVSFSISNFRSFDAEQTFSMVSSKRSAQEYSSHLIGIPDCDEHVLRAGVLYGANGAGRSNLFKALRYVKTIALSARKSGRGTGHDPFRLADTGSRPSTFDLQFIATGGLYRYGFSVDDEHIVEEWLVQVVGSRERPVYERRTDTAGQVEIEAAFLTKENHKLAALVTVGGPPNQSFLATVRGNLTPQDFGATLTAVITRFDTSLNLVGPWSNPVRLAQRLATDPGLLDFAGSFLNAASTGVDAVHVDRAEIPAKEVDAVVPRSVASYMRKSGALASATAADGSDLLFEKNGSGEHFYRIHFRRCTTAHRAGRSHSSCRRNLMVLVACGA